MTDSDISLPSPAPGQERIVIVGAGVVGSCLAQFLTATSTFQVVLVDRDVEGLPGSSRCASGFIGQLNVLPELTELAKRSVNHYLSIEGGLEMVGGLEVAETEAGELALKERLDLATKAGLPARIISTEEACALAPPFIRPETTKSALFFERDAKGNPRVISENERAKAKSQGAILVDADVLAIERSENGRIKVLKTNRGSILTDKVVFCTGFWASQLLTNLPVVPVAHPYAYSKPRKSPRSQATPFIRWPESHVYARDHGLMDGIGSYDHHPIPYQASSLPRSALGVWFSTFTHVLEKAGQKLPSGTFKDFSFTDTSPEAAFNGIFSVTPDGLPFVGEVEPGSDIWCAVAVWVTQAGGTAKLVSDLLQGKLDPEDQWLLDAMRPNRFEGENIGVLREEAARKYNDIYNKGTD